ncbi:MAG TPA: chloride channel protein [Oscillatoriales cyanobacterium M4454_W2019_049]|nr:chloride channel protein [Oscillatoriales cyanobacterium M4454_W2019_049]
MTPTSPKPNVLPSLQPQTLSISDRLTHLLDRLQPSPEVLVFLTALLIGGGAGGAMVLFHHWIELCETIAFVPVLNQLSRLGGWAVMLVPALGGLLVGLLRWQFPNDLGQGISGLLSNTRSQPISIWRPGLTLLAAGISLGTGASLGPEGPSVEIGATIGLLLGQTFQVSKERYRLLLGAGAAAGLAAGFNAPIAGIFFALEIILGTAFTTPAISLILLSAVIAAIISKANFGADPAFNVPVYQGSSVGEWLLYLGLGVLASGVSILLIQTVQIVRAEFEEPTLVKGLPNPIAQLPLPLKPMLGGLIVGGVALYLPQVLGIGYGTLELILQDVFPTHLLGILLLAKIFLVAVCLGSGFVGGLFAPALLIGGCLGSLYGHLVSAVLPAEWMAIAPASAYATVGMAAVLAGSVRAPLTAMILLFEMTQNYHIVLPLMTAVGMSVWLVDLAKSSQTVEKLDFQQMGFNLQEMQEYSLLENVTVADYLSTDYVALPKTLTLLEASQALLQSQCHTALVLDRDGQLYGIIALSDIRRQLAPFKLDGSHSESDGASKNPSAFLLKDRADMQPILQQPIDQFCTTEILYSYNDDSLWSAWQEMGARGLYLLPVVERDNPRKVLGVIEAQRIEIASDLTLLKQLLEPYLELETALDAA